MEDEYTVLTETQEVNEETIKPACRGFLKYTKKSNRTRLYFQGLRSEYPEIANTVELTRSRVSDLQAKFRQDASKALRKFHYATFCSIVGTALGAGIGLNLALKSSAPVGVALIPTIAVIIALFPAASAAYGWHNMFKAMFSAAWKLKGLKSKMDQELIIIAHQAQNKKKLSKALMERLDESISEWTESLEQILSHFGEELGGAISPISLPEIPARYNQPKQSKRPLSSGG